MKKVFIFHGTEGDPEENWMPWIRRQLESHGVEVIIPKFPSPPYIPAKVSEWFDVIDQHIESMDEETIIVGHSLGGVFALRVLEKIQQPIKATFFTGTPIGVKPILNFDRDQAFSGFDFDWTRISCSSLHFEVFHSDNDPFVSLANGQRLANNLGVDINLIKDGGHFTIKSGYAKFPQLLNKICKCIESTGV